MKTTEETLRSENEPLTWQDGPHERPGRRRGTGSPAGTGGGAAPTTAVLPLQVLRLSELPEGLSPLRGGLRVRVVASPIQASMSFERTCAGCRERRGGAGPQPCDRCGEITETVWRWICARCGRDTQMGAALCPRCRPATRAEKRGGQLRLW